MPSNSSFARFSICRLALVISFALSAAVSAYSQGVLPGSSRGPNTGSGNNTIQGRVHFPSGQSTGTVKVNLETTSSFGASSSTATDQDGVFRFNGLEPGNYTVVVDAGNQYEKAREPVVISTESRGRLVQVAIQLHLKIDASNPAFAGISEKALNLYQKGTAAVKKGDSKAAVQFFTEAIAAYPNFPMALSDLGFQYMKLNQMDKAAETYEELIKLKPADPTAHLNLGIARYNQKKFEEAETHLRKAVDLKATGPMAHYYLGMTLVSLKRHSEALPEFEATVANGGENIALAHRYLGGLYMSANKNQQAADELEKYLKLDPKAPDAERIKGTIKDLRSKQ
ncbi:MAG TPA: tetratricopeptide repeat protein [Pyrinomonadaceae bacterium]|nr:tetratricopeptide repeat protein [Pyrinomonadaceae bacterium]